MFGDERAIIDEFPKYFLDYREKMSDDVRWDYRIISSEGTWSGNIYDFYFKIINKITDDLNVPFKLVNGIRQEETRVHEAVREAVANSLIHADYRLPRGIVIEKGKTYFKISNPGSLRITREEALRGGISDPRNENIFKMFNLLGIGERAGSGLENIQLAWKEEEWLAPDLEEEFNPDRIILILRTISMLPEQSIKLLKCVLKDKYDMLSKEEVLALVSAHQEGCVTNNRLQQLLDTHSIKSNKILSALVDKGYLEADGIGRGTKYHLSKDFEVSEDDELDVSKDNKNITEVAGLTVDERKVIDYINKNKFINTKLCKLNLGFGKTKSVEIFNKLMRLNIIIRVGNGSKIRYELINKEIED